MSNDAAFVGDVHGNLAALVGLVDALAEHGRPHMVFLGDYINKGEYSAEVIAEVIKYSSAERATLLKGNHEVAVLNALASGSLTSFLKMGGAMTIRSYVGPRVGPDVLAEFVAHFPSDHLQAIREMPETFESADVIAQHGPFESPSPKFQVSAHMPVGDLPRINRGSAQIDTGCGVESGRLTALLWPSLHIVQVDATGRRVNVGDRRP